MKRFDIICMGEAMGEIAFSADMSAQVAIGGDTFNSAVYLAREGCKVAFASAVGSDPFGCMIAGALAREGIDPSLLRVFPEYSTGLYSISNDPLGERSFHYWRAQSAARQALASPWPALEAACAETRLILFSGITLYTFADHLDALFALLKRARQEGATICFDGNFRPKLWAGDMEKTREVFARALDASQILLPTYDDELALWGHSDLHVTLDRLAAHGADLIVVKNGADGCVLRGAAGADQYIAVPNPVTPVDTTAAGDSFNAAFLAALLRDYTPQSAALAGHRLAAKVIAHRGALLPETETVRET